MNTALCPSTPNPSGPNADAGAPSVLIIDDDPDILRALDMVLSRVPYRIATATSAEAALTQLTQHRFGVILLDLNLTRGRSDGEDGMALLTRICAADADAVVIVITAHSGLAKAVSAMQAGASDFITKPWANARLLASVARAVKLRRERGTAPLAQPALIAADGAPMMIGDSPAFRTFVDQVQRAALSRLPVLVTGAPGSGKSLAVRALVAASPLHGRFVAVPALLAADHGWEKVAAGDMLAIEDMDQLDSLGQARLVRRLEKESNGARLIGTAREGASLSGDLLDRIGLVEFALPALSARGDDCLLLARHFARSAAASGSPVMTFTSECEARLRDHHWPNGVRGLARAVTGAAIRLVGGACTPADLGLEQLPEPGCDALSAPPAATLEETERTAVRAALQRHGFNISHAAAELGLSRGALYRRMAKYGI